MEKKFREITEIVGPSGECSKLVGFYFAFKLLYIVKVKYSYYKFSLMWKKKEQCTATSNNSFSLHTSTKDKPLVT